MESRDARALSEFAAALERAGVRYAVGGSIASSYFGEPRSTLDVDILIELEPTRIPELVRELSRDFLVTEDDIRDAILRRTNFNAIHARAFTRMDVYIAGDSELDRAQLERRVEQPLHEHTSETIQVTAPEVLVLRKLDWFRKGQLLSDRQWLDVLGVLKKQAHHLDLAYMRDLASQTGLDYLLRRALDDAGLAENH